MNVRRRARVTVNTMQAPKPMTTSSASFKIALAAFLAAGLATAHAQYPTIYPDTAQMSAERKAAADRRSDAKWEKALPIVKE